MIRRYALNLSNKIISELRQFTRSVLDFCNIIIDLVPDTFHLDVETDLGRCIGDSLRLDRISRMIVDNRIKVGYYLLLFKISNINFANTVSNVNNLVLDTLHEQNITTIRG